MKAFVIPAVLLFVASGVGARPQEETSFIPLPTVIHPSISSGFPPLPTTFMSLTPRPPTSSSSQPSTTELPSATGTSSAVSSQATGTSASASLTSSIASVTSALSSAASSVASASASASPTNNAAPAHFESLKVHGLAALGIATSVFASMLFML